MSPPISHRPELLAPAGDWDCVRAAVENGADAVYFGLDCGFNARARAKNFASDELPGVLAFLQRRGVRGYVTLNTLVFPSELPGIEQLIQHVARCGTDAVLVQDLGLVRLIRAICPELPIHASTQMTLTSAECIREVEALGVERVVLARELSIREITRIHSQTSMQLETFVHGALCVAYSGQCLTSESLGGRSANRGQCAQACRLPYELVCDDRDVDLGDVRYLLSPQDLAAFELVPDLIQAGIVSFKIEGRLKAPEYVANITRHYREAIDKAVAGRPVQFSPSQIREMELSFSRGFSPGWLQGCDHKMLVPGLSSAKRGILLGRITQITEQLRNPQVTVELTAPVAPGDGVVFEGDRAGGQELGGRVFEVYQRGRRQDGIVESGTVELGFDRESFDPRQLRIGQQVWKTDDPRLAARLRKTYSGPDPTRRVPIDVSLVAVVGQKLRIEAVSDCGGRAAAESDDELAVARKHPLTPEVLREQMGRLGGTVYELRELSADITGAPMVPLSVLGRLRHELIRQLDESVVQDRHRQVANDSVLSGVRAATGAEAGRDVGTNARPASHVPNRPPTLHVLCRSLEQLRTVIENGVHSVSVDFQDIREFPQAVEMAHARGVRILLATPRIQKPDELGLYHVMARYGADGILVRNLAGLAFFADRSMPVIADFSLNAANELTVDYLRVRGADRVTVAYDLNRDQLFELVDATTPSWLEVVIHQHMPMFHMEHCVFCAVLSPGTNKTNCGRPCDVHQVQLRDRIGMLHPLKADVGCRNTLFNAVPQSSAEVVASLLDRGVRDFRVELLDSGPTETAAIVEVYRDLLSGRLTGKQVWQRLQATNRVGVTRGTLEERRNPLAIL